MKRSPVILAATTLCLVATSALAQEKPMLAGAKGVTNPARLEESYIRPTYPEEAKMVGVGGQVILQAIITKEGAVKKIEVLKSTSPGHGFEDAAIEAVKLWRYTPALYKGMPVDVYFTIAVNFDLSSHITHAKSGGAGPAFPGKEGVTNPVRIPRAYVKPIYPEEAREKKINGKVILRVIITEDGRVRDLTVIKSTSPGYGFEEAAKEAVRQWRYGPAMKDNRPVEVYFHINVDFTTQ